MQGLSLKQKDIFGFKTVEEAAEPRSLEIWKPKEDRQ